MPANEFSIRIRIDGAQARADASRIRKTIEAELTKITTVSFDTKSLEKVMKVAGKLSIAGVVEIGGLEVATERIKLLQAMAAQRLTIRGSVDIGGLKAARAQMQGIRDDAGGLGRAIATGLGRQQAFLERHLTNLQSRITGLVRAGEKMDMDAPLEGLEKLGQGLADDEKKAYGLFLRMRTLNAESEELNKRFATLGATKFMPQGAGGMQSLKQLFAIFESPHYRGKIKKAISGITAELAPLSANLQVAMDEATATAAAARGPLLVEIEKLQTEMEQALAAKPIRPTVAGELAGWREATAEWEMGFAEMERRYLEMTSRLDQVRSVALTGDAENLKSEISLRRNMLQAPLEQEFQFWREWSMTSVEEIAESLRHTGQSAAADALREMYAIWETRKKVESQLKRGAGRLRKGAQAELPAGAAGTMVDFIASERVLEQAASGATEQLKLQWAQLGRLTKRFDSAAMAADGLSEAERMAFQRMQQLAAREIKKRTPLTTTTLEESGAVAQAVLVRLSQQAAEVRKAMLAALAPPDLPAAVAATVGDPSIEQAAAGPVQAIAGLWERLRMRLVGRSIVPEMVQEINVWLAQIGQESPFAAVVGQAEDGAGRVVRAFSGMAAALPMEQVADQVRMLSAEIRSLSSEFGSMTVRGSEASRKYRADFEEAVEQARRMRGVSPEDEARYATGQLPRGFGMGEARFHEAGRARAPGEVGELTDEWYRALNTEMEEVRRFSQEERSRLDQLAQSITSKQAQMAALLRAQLEQAATAYSKALTETQDPAEFERLYQQLDATGVEIEVAQAQLTDAVSGVEAMVADEVREVAEKAKAQAQAFARTPAGKAVEEEAKRATAAVIQGEKRQTATVVSQVKYRQKQKEEAAKRATLKAKAVRQAEIEAAKAVSRSQIEMAKATARGEIEAAKRVTAVTAQQLKERDRAHREAQVATRQRGEAQRLAGDLGIQWDTVVQKTLDAGYSMETVVGALRRVQREQRQVGKGAKRTADGYNEATTSVGRFVQELNRARMSSHGIAMILNDVSRMGRTLQFTGTALAGSLTMAGRSYLELATQTDIASRSLLLNQELTEEMRDQVVKMSADMAMLDPQATAKGVTIWAQATGQAVDSSEDLLRVLRQTVPVQQLAALAQENIETVTDGAAATLRQFNLTLDDTPRVVAIFNKVADDTLATVGDMSEAFKYVGPQAYEMGEAVEETAAILGIMADQNIRGSTAGRAYRMMLLSLVEPSTKAKEALEETFGEEQPFYDAEGQFVGLAQVIDMLAAATENATDEERELLLATLFTANAIPAVTGLVDEQTEARSRGINAARAEAKLLAGVIDEEVRMYGEMKQQVDGTTIAMMGAMDLWERQLDDWEESDVYRVKQAEMRWKGFWLAIGEQAVSAALPAIQEAARLLEYVTSLIQSGGPLGGLIGVLVPAGGAMIAIGTLVSAVTGVGRAIFGLRMVATALKTTMEGQMVAGGRFQGQVVSAGEQFRAIVTGAAQQAAAIEQGGAEAETAIEVAGGEAETAIEVAGGEAETAIEVAGGATETATEVAGAIAETAAVVAGLVILPVLLAAVLHDAMAETGVGQAMGFKRGTAGKLASIGAYYAGRAVGGEEMGQQMLAGTAGVLGAGGRAGGDQLPPSLMMLPVVLRDMDTAAGDVEGKVKKLTGGLYDLGDGLGDVVKLTDEEVKAAELYVEMLQKQAEALKKFNEQMAEALSNLEKDLAEMAADYHDRRQELEQSWQEEDLRSVQDHNDRKAKAAADHAVKMRRMDEDHLLRMRDLARGRDAYGMRKELQQHKLQRSRAEEDFGRSQGDSDVQFERQREVRRQQHERELADARAEHEEEKAERKAEYEERKVELQTQHAEDQARLTKEYFDKINAELAYFALSKTQTALYQAAMLADATAFLTANRAIWQDHLRNLPVPSRTRPIPPGGDPEPGYQMGGYVSKTGGAYMHAGEFVLNPGATRQAERSLGPLTQAKLMAGMAGMGAQRPAVSMQLNQNYTFHGSLSVAERRWFRETARNEARGQFEEALRGIPVRTD